MEMRACARVSTRACAHMLAVGNCMRDCCCSSACTTATVHECASAYACARRCEQVCALKSTRERLRHNGAGQRVLLYV
eukprot:961044-Pleurochrysis_carterae.AAC.1